MLSFGDDTLFADINIEKNSRVLRERDGNEDSRKENNCHVGEIDKDTSKLSHIKLSESFVKYFEDSITFSKINGSKNASSASSISKGDTILSSRSPRGNKGSFKMTNSREKHLCGVVNSGKKSDKSVQNLCKNGSHDNVCDNVVSGSSVEMSASIDTTCDREISNIILSRALCTQERCKLASWGLPSNILQKYIARGVDRMFEWQMECLSNHQVMQERKNLVYSAPTSAGKTLVAEILLIKTILERKKKVIFILPFVSVVREKMYYFQDLLSDIGIRVEGFMGGNVPHGGFAATHVAIATIEKANSLVNHLMEENDLSSLGAVIIDELHLLGDPNRGYLLELLLTKLKYMTVRNDDINIQLIGMSATLPNLVLLAKWLNAELYNTEFRPIPLNEYCKIGDSIYDNKLNLVRKLTELPELEQDVDNILQLCIETIKSSHSVLIFCPTKKWCEKLAEQIAAAFYKLGCKNTVLGEMLRKEINNVLIQETLEQLKRSPSGLDNILKNTISFGIAFHHAGLTMDERDIIEGSFRTGSLRVLIATSTLSSGVNLPARRVIIRSPLFGNTPLNTLTYKQMIGRAGRMGKDSAGESILICKPTERNTASSLLSATLDPIESCLNDFTLLIRALLEAVASEVLYTLEDLKLYINCTLLSLSEPSDIQTFSDEAIKFLLDNEFLLLQTTERETRWVATPLGKACLAASIPPREGLFLFEELQKARRCFVLDTELHVIYLVTPLSAGCQIGTVDWMVFHELWNTMSESERRVGKLIGVEERFVMSAIKGVIKPGKSLNIHRRFYSALALHDLVKEVPLHVVCKKYGCCRGVLQTLQQSASTYAGMVTQFCKQLGWDCMELLVSQFQTRLQFGVCRELLDLLRLPMLNGLRARSLYKQGITCVADLAVANELNVERALYKALPFESEKEYEGEYAFDAEKRNKMRTVFVTGRDGLTPQQAAVLLVQEARILVQKELGLEQLPWEQNEQQSLQINTHLEVKATPDTTEEITRELDAKNSKSIETFIDSKYEKPASDENQRDDNSKLNIFKETDESNMPDKRKTIQSNNQHLNGAILSQKISKDEKDSVSLDINISDVVLNDERLNISDIVTNHEGPNTCKGKKNSLTTDSSSKIKRRSNNTEESKQHVDDIPNKKSKTFNVDEVKSNGENLIEKNATESSINKDIKSPYSRSPSLFDDSLNLDTQTCDLLEQNIMDIAYISELDSKLFASDLDLKKSSSEVGEKQLRAKTDENNVNKLLQTRDSVLSWGDDSWNNSEKVFKQIIQVASDQSSKKEISAAAKIKNITDTNVSVTPKSTKTCVSNGDKESLRKTNLIKKRTALIEEKVEPWKPKLPKVAKVESPITSIIINERKMSVESNKSDSDDIIVGSQQIESPLCDSKNRTRTKLEKIRKLRSQKMTEDTLTEINDRSNSTVNGVSNDKPDDQTKPKLKETLEQNFSPNCSADSIVYNSEDETTLKSVSRTKQETQSRLNKNVKSEIEAAEDLPNETINWNVLNIVKVADNRATFNLFKRVVLKKRNIALALHCDTFVDNANSIGSKICVSSSNAEGKRKSRKSANYAHGKLEIRGAAISWESNIAYYLSFSNLSVSRKEQMTLLKELFADTDLYMKCFATKDIYKALYQCCGISAKCRFLDPIIAHWLCTNDCEKSFNEMVTQYFPQGNFIMNRTNCCYWSGPGMDVHNSLPGEYRSAAEAVLTWHMMDNVMNKLEELNPALLYTFREVEMRTVTLLACMELSGINVNIKSLEELSLVTSNEMQSLEKKAYHLAGKKFNFSSSKEVGQVLGLYKDKKVSTSKAVLEKCDNPISNLVISWRKLSATKTKIIQPLLHLAQKDPRIHGNCITCTVTGRVSMHEPNLQNVPKDFGFSDNNFVLSVRMAFVPALGNIMLSADYCQLELRLLTHFSQDSILCEILKQPGDIFKNIAAKWNNVPEEEVTVEMRQRTKQLCYGMIYGMGVKSLAENLCVSEPEAQEFLESFMNTYPGIYKWLDDVLEEAHRDAYVTTLLGRRRQLPDLKNTKSSVRAQAERQAVNTKVQGSAADIVKKAMISIEERIRCKFPDSAIIFPEVQTRKLRSNSRDMQQRGAYLVLQLHDELLYEVNLADLTEVAEIIKVSMEKVCQLTVPLPVKIKVGPAWGDLTDY
ncbi:DNA polymerase theta [Nylanderia fulva]|uniref:DNA polymerase theta n=1 Tax=Nylanderia fulva TaxID=613905 RepID=UPI0010FB2201|nr:DNA polymerase theta [Nylanderia fulva]